jgi:hypothetical protein
LEDNIFLHAEQEKHLFEVASIEENTRNRVLNRIFVKLRGNVRPPVEILKVGERLTIKFVVENGEVLHHGHLPSVPAPDDLDLASIDCPIPDGVIPIPIDWQTRVSTTEEVLALGYPHVALHHPALQHVRGRIAIRAKHLYGQESLLLPGMAGPGCSGGRY